MIRGVLIDLSGVIRSGGARLPGAREGLAALVAADLPHRFLTNATRQPLRAVAEDLAGFGLAVPQAHIFAPARAAADWLRHRGYAPHLLIHPALAEDFADCPKTGAAAVVVGDAGRFFTYDRLNVAFRRLIAGAPFLALAANRVFRDADGGLSMDAGGFVAALEHASGVAPLILGKPAPTFFTAAAGAMGRALGEVAMIGDDAEADVAGALRAGAGAAVLVRTGKYRPGDETRIDPPPSAVVADFGAAVDWLLARAGGAPG